MDNAKAAKDTPHYHGHRDRLRARFVEGGEAALQDYELLELVLFTLIPRKDVKPLAKDLIAHFGSLHEMMAASIEALQQVDGVSYNCAVGLKSMFALNLRAMKREFKANIYK
jgi:DNA repair protein RadC